MKIAGLQIKGVTSSSKDVKKDFVFVAIKGPWQDGNCFINEAITRGASVIVIKNTAKETKIIGKAKLLKVSNPRKFLADVCAEFYGFPSNKLKVIGITGTNGKTTISYLVEAVAKEANCGSGVIGTINYRFKNKIIPAKNTTPGCVQLQELLCKMFAKKVKYCAMEVSSHALDQNRVAGVNFSCAIFTNLTQDHLDYHQNLENYFLAKAKLFRSLAASSVAVINNDDKYGQRIKRLTKAKVITYGIRNKSMVMAKELDLGHEKTEFTLIAPKINIRIKARLVGKYNVYNILSAVAWALSQKINIKIIKAAIEKFKNVPGRLERVVTKKGFNIFVDYAHTPDALFNVISALRPISKKRIIVVFGCGGGRDKLKRPKMGKVVTELADYALITSDNPRSEEPLQIIKDIQKGINKNNYCVVLARAEAIRKGLAMLEKDDCLLIAGKGHENYQVLKDKVLQFNDRKEVEKCLLLKK
ncbi:MAG: UDP-N-acetylmuramoyl-L-alanyl-D-glutamate--2,6-diaminopimelate ligase [Candidatus Omnitrophota bacterium]